MRRMRINYWSCSKVADALRSLLRASQKPKFATSQEWKEWRESNKDSFSYKLTEDYLDNLQNVVMFPSDVYHVAKCYVLNRFVTKVHYLKTGLPKGRWVDLDQRILYGLMNELEIYVREELGWMYHAFHEDQSNWKWYLLEDSQKLAKGLAKLDDQIQCRERDDDTHGVEKDIKEILSWWWLKRTGVEDTTFPMKEDGTIDYPAAWEQDERLEKEEDEMLVRLLKIRRNLWT